MIAGSYARAFFAMAFALVLACLTTTRAVARVDLPSLDLIDGYYNDISVEGGLPMQFERYYASKSTFVGMLGYGWQDPFEAELDVRPDGSFVIKEFGGGANNYFVPPTPARTPYYIIRDLMAAADKVNLFGSTDQRTAYEASLLNGNANSSSSLLRQNAWTRFHNLGLVSDPNVGIGETFLSETSGDFVTRVPEGYERYDAQTDQYEAFTDTGRLQRIWNSDHEFVQLGWKVNESPYLASSVARIETLQDGLGNVFTLSYTYNSEFDEWLVAKVADQKHHRSSIYGYDKYSNLISNKNMDGVTFRYVYDDYHNLLRVYRRGALETTITYSEPTYGTVGSVKDAGNNVVSFKKEYEGPQDDPTAALIDVTLTRADGTTQIYHYRVPINGTGNYDYAHETGPPPPMLTIQVGGQTLPSPGTWVMQ